MVGWGEENGWAGVVYNLLELGVKVKGSDAGDIINRKPIWTILNADLAARLFWDACIVGGLVDGHDQRMLLSIAVQHAWRARAHACAG